ncbi:MAG: cytochrome c oxidase subunit 3, partial [Nitrospira sp.]|nr:cytochrome c oxidase subunit 3 [Nitrospira sp.]
MGIPLPNGKLAMWLFLVTEIMFFTALIGTYLIYRNGQPTASMPWPTPQDVHLAEHWGAINTFVLICSSLTVVLAHWNLHSGNVKRAVLHLGVTLALGGVFLVIKAWEYYGKFEHGILPGRVFEKLDSHRGFEYVRHVEKQLEHIVNHGGVNDQAMKACKELLEDIKAGKVRPKEVNERVRGTETIKRTNPGPDRITTQPSTYAELPEKSRPAGAPLIKGILEMD